MTDEEPEKTKHNPSKNLTPFKSGEEWTGNAAGRKKGSKNRSTIFRDILESPAFNSLKSKQNKELNENNEGDEEIEFNPETVADQLAMAVLMKGFNGNIVAAKEALDSAYGKLTEKVENEHAFVKMGKVTKKTGELSAPEGQEEQELTFNVGKPAPQPEEQEL